MPIRSNRGTIVNLGAIGYLKAAADVKVNKNKL